MWFLATLSVLAVTTGASSFSNVRLAKSWRRNSRASDCETCGWTRLLRVEEEQSLLGILQDRIGDAVAGAERAPASRARVGCA